jgi:hypothetical protein
MTETEETDIVEVQPSVVKPAVSPREAKENWQLFQNLKRELLDKGDYAKIQQKNYIKKSGFRKLAVAFNISDEIIEEERTEREDGSFFWRIKVKATAPNGRCSTGVAICDSRERNFAHVEHDVYATAHTRAKNRAISDLVAGGVVSYEEMETAAPQPEPKKHNPQPQAREKKQTEQDRLEDREQALWRIEEGNLRVDFPFLGTKKISKWKDALKDMKCVGIWHPDVSEWEVKRKGADVLAEHQIAKVLEILESLGLEPVEVPQ